MVNCVAHSLRRLYFHQDLDGAFKTPFTALERWCAEERTGCCLGWEGGAAGLLQMQVPPGNTASAKANKAYACSPGRGCCQCPCTASKPQLIPSQSARVAAVDAFDYMV